MPVRLPAPGWNATCVRIPGCGSCLLPLTSAHPSARCQGRSQRHRFDLDTSRRNVAMSLRPEFASVLPFEVHRCRLASALVTATCTALLTLLAAPADATDVDGAPDC